METKNFNEDLEFGELGQKLFKESNAWKLLFPNQELIEITDKEGQHFKGDFSIGKEFLEIKTRKPGYCNFCAQDIVIELSNTNQGKEVFKAWLDKYSENTYLIYQWTKIENQKLVLMRPIIVFKPIDLRKHMSWLKKYKLKSSPNQGYDTNFITIKLNNLKKKIPVKTITWNKII